MLGRKGGKRQYWPPKNVSRNQIIPLELYLAPWPSLDDVARFLEAKKLEQMININNFVVGEVEKS